jgi:hypothetical protein
MTAAQRRTVRRVTPATLTGVSGRPTLASAGETKLRTPGTEREDFVAALYNDFQDHGSAAIAACRAEKPDVYVRVIAGILPKDVNMRVAPLDDLTDEQLLRKLNILTEMARPLLARVVPENAGTDAGTGKPIDVEFSGISKS